MADPISLTLAAVPIIQPLIRAAYDAIGLHRLNRSFGKDYHEYCRKLDGQKARMEEWSHWPISLPQNDPKDNFDKQILAQLGAIVANLEICAALRRKYETDAQTSDEAAGDDSALGLEVTEIWPASNETAEQSKIALPNQRLPNPKAASRNNSKNQPSPKHHSTPRLRRLEPISIVNLSLSDELAGNSIHYPSNKLNIEHSQGGVYLHRIVSQQREDAVHMQKNTSVLKRLQWVFKDREEYKACVKKITSSNDLIEGLVRARALNFAKSRRTSKKDWETQSIITTKFEPEDNKQTALHTLPAEDQSSINVLARLHDALTHSEVTDLPKESRFGLQISLDHSLTKDCLLEQFEKLPFRPVSHVCMLQAIKPLVLNESTFLIAESSTEPSTAQSIPQSHKEDLEPFIHIGDISTVPSDIHRLFRDSTLWTPILTLKDLISSSKKPPSPATRFKLAAYLAATRLHFSELTYTPGQLNPESFQYFDHSTEAESIKREDLLEDEDRLVSPYYFSGIGSVRPKSSTRAIGTSRGKLSFDIATMDLGFLLYQIGSWKLLERCRATSNIQREELRAAVKEKFHELNREAGLRYAETVEKCLDWKHQPPKNRQSDILRLYYEVVKLLKDLDEQVRLS